MVESDATVLLYDYKSISVKVKRTGLGLFAEKHCRAVNNTIHAEGPKLMLMMRPRFTAAS